MALDNSDYVDVVIHPIAIAAWFHIAARLQHAKQTASGLSTDEPGRLQAKITALRTLEVSEFATDWSLQFDPGYDASLPGLSGERTRTDCDF